MPKIIYQEPYQEIVLDQEPGGTILEASLANGIAHYHACGGKGRCTTCRVLVVDGAASLLPRTDAEIRPSLLGRAGSSAAIIHPAAGASLPSVVGAMAATPCRQ